MAKLLSIDEFEAFREEAVESLAPVFSGEVEKETEESEAGSQEHLLKLQLLMATTSVNHEYARMEFDETADQDRKEELMAYMSDCRLKYENAREELSFWNPLILEDFEKDLVFQKHTTLKHYHA